MIIPGISLYLILAVMQLLTADSTYPQIILAVSSCLLIFAVNIIVYLLFNRIGVLHQQKEQYQMMEQQSRLQYRYFRELEQKYESSRKLFHDVKNHINTLEQLYKNNDNDRNEYSQPLRKRIDDLTLPVTGHRVLNILLSDRKAAVEAHGIDFIINCEEADLSFISDFDLTTILSNLLDNAFDECTGNDMAEKRIELSLCQINHFIVLIITNTCSSRPQKQQNRFVSGKAGHSGLGLANVQETAEKYQGTMNAEFKEQSFTVQITFPGASSSC